MYTILPHDITGNESSMLKCNTIEVVQRTCFFCSRKKTFTNLSRIWIRRYRDNYNPYIQVYFFDNNTQQAYTLYDVTEINVMD